MNLRKRLINFIGFTYSGNLRWQSVGGLLIIAVQLNVGSVYDLKHIFACET